MPITALDTAEDFDANAKPISAAIIHDGYAAEIQFDNKQKIDFPSDFVLHVCEPSYGWYKDKRRATSGVGARIREIRGFRGLTLDQLAKKSGIAKPNLSRLENDKVTPTLATLAMVARALSTHPVLLVSGKKRNDAWTWTRHAFTQWKHSLLWQESAQGPPMVQVRTVDMVRLFLSKWPEHRYAKMRLLNHVNRAPHDADLATLSLDAAKWKVAREG
jgi:transcriptional regulator with XRE-family HTH domain